MSVAHKPLRSSLTWFGGKGHLARHIVPLLLLHEAYVEPFFGGGSLFFWSVWPLSERGETQRSGS